MISKDFIACDIPIVGISEIDDDHIFISKLLLTADNMTDECDSATVIDLADKIIDASERHFAREEELMTQLCYYKADSHKKEHGKFKPNIERIISSYKQSNHNLIIIAMKQATSLWYRKHINRYDDDFSEFIKNNSDNYDYTSVLAKLHPFVERECRRDVERKENIIYLANIGKIQYKL